MNKKSLAPVVPLRREFLRGVGYTAAALAVSSRLRADDVPQPAYRASTDASDDPLFMSATKLAGLIRSRQISAAEAVKLHIAQIEAWHPKINAVVATCFERALYEAETADGALARGDKLGALHGVPMTIKDSFDTEGVVSTAGTLGRKDFVPGYDATVVARARAAGAIMLGKTNTPEFTLGGGGRGTFNLVYGMTNNPYDIRYQPGASSGGSGANVASGGASFDIGSDIAGSVRYPAHINGVVGLKPTFGRTSRFGHIVGYGGAYDSFQETGPLARRVEDLALLMPIISGPDNRDCALAPVPFGDPWAVNVRKLRVAFFATNGENHPTQEIQAMVKRCAQYFAAAGCRVTEDMPPMMGELGYARGVVSSASDGYLTKTLLARAGTKQAGPGLMYPGDPKPAGEFTRAYELLDAARSAQLAWFENYDVIVCPVSTRAGNPHGYESPPSPPSKPGRANPYYMAGFNTNGWPAGVVRAGTSKEDPGLPLGVQVVGQPWRDDVVIAALAHIEKHSGGFVPPKLPA
ncbi:amidase [Povalibacter sp.]|uniref:amidase n=1 Tax=Povalibacter sp. TaxID=1962978 RepID=UPI002F3E5990